MFVCFLLVGQYLLAPTLKDGQEMSEEEQQRVFGLVINPLRQMPTTGGGASADEFGPGGDHEAIDSPIPHDAFDHDVEAEAAAAAEVEVVAEEGFDGME